MNSLLAEAQPPCRDSSTPILAASVHTPPPKPGQELPRLLWLVFSGIIKAPYSSGSRLR